MNDKTILSLYLSRSAGQWVIRSQSNLRNFFEFVICDDMLTPLNIVEDTRMLFTGTGREVSTAVRRFPSHTNPGAISLLRMIVSIGK
jgi:hypothetical protein